LADLGGSIRWDRAISLSPRELSTFLSRDPSAALGGGFFPKIPQTHNGKDESPMLDRAFDLAFGPGRANSATSNPESARAGCVPSKERR